MKKKSKCTIQLLNHNNLDKFKYFIRDQWSNNHIFSYDSSVFDWQHKGAKSYHCMAAFVGKDLIGVHCVIPLYHFDDCLPKDQIFLSLWKAIEDKEVGVGLRLYKGILKQYDPKFIGALGINPRVLFVFKWLGFTTGIMEHHVFLSPFVDDFKVAIVPESLNNKVDTKRKNVNEKLSLSLLKFDKTKLKNFDTKLIYSYQYPTKSDSYIVNRYIEHPIYKYDIYALTNDQKVVALFVIRPIIINDSVVLRLVDYIGNNDFFSELHNYLLEILKEFKAEYIDIYSYGLPLNVLSEAGFINRRKIHNLIIPDYFEPFERENNEVSYAYSDKIKDKPVRLFKADGDTDRPSKISKNIK